MYPSAPPKKQPSAARAHLLRVATLLFLTTVVILACTIPSFGLFPTAPTQSFDLETQVAAQVTALAATATALRQPPPGEAALPTYTFPPTYTPLPTYTPEPTYTPWPTYTPAHSLTPYYPPLITLYPTYSYATEPSPYGRPYVLRVFNYGRETYWIGTTRPYGGNFIKPRGYIEFYPPEPVVMRVWWCRFTPFFYKHWRDYDWLYLESWKDHLYDCRSRDVKVDKPLVTISVQ